MLSAESKKPARVRRTYAGIAVMCCIVGIVGLLACWIVPYRMYQGQGYYGFAYVSDEITYAYRSQPLIAGTTAANPVNGIGDANIVSPFFLEDTCRAFLSATGMDVVTAFWAWRIGFPVALGLSLALLIRTCFRRHRPWNRALVGSFAALGVPAMYALYHIFWNTIPLHGWLDRVPTNIEYPLSILTFAAYLRVIDQPTRKNGMYMVLASTALLYLRPYAAIPFVFMLGIGVVVLLATRRVAFRDCAPALCLLAVAVAPWAAINQWNSQSPEYREMIERYFFVEGYKLHERSALFAGIAAAMIAAAQLAAPRRRVFFYTGALGLLALVFVCGLPKIASELLTDRFGCFYIPLVFAAVALVIDHRLSVRKGRAGEHAAKLVSLGACGCALAASIYIGQMNLNCDFLQWPNGPYQICASEKVYLRGYQWVRQHTASDALVLVDDGIDWTKAPQDARGLQEFSASLKLTSLDDLFQVVARRRRVHHMRLYGNIISTRDLLALGLLHRGTFGRAVDEKAYMVALTHFAPKYIFWKKDAAPIWRTQVPALQGLCTKVYGDHACEVWEIALPASIEPSAAAGK